MKSRGRPPFGSRTKVSLRSWKRSFNSAPGRLPVIAASWQKRRSCIRYQPQGKVISVVDRITRANSATSSTYIVAFGRPFRERPFSIATIASTYRKSAASTDIDIDTQSESHVTDLNMDIFAELMSNLGLVDQMPPLPKCIERAFGFQSRGATTSILSPSLVTPP